MKKYEVVHFFTDLRDYDHPYNVGDEFPRQGVTVSEERLAELSSSNNKQRIPLIKAVGEPDGQKPEEQKPQNNPPQGGTPEQSVEPENTGKVENSDQTVTPETPENPEPTATPNVSEESKKYSKEDIEALKLKQIREIAGQLGFKISSTSKDGAVVEFMEKQG